ncbi:hypothetical protein WDW86_10010 [Bdellovibrionota bacterium FG-2]
MSKIDQKSGIRGLEGIFNNRRLSAKITRHCSDYSRLHYFHPDQSDGTKFFDGFPSAEVKALAFAIEGQFLKLILSERVHGVPLEGLNEPQWQEHWRLITWLIIDAISERFFLELDGLGISELPTLHEYTSFSQKSVRKVCHPDLLAALDGSLRVAKSRSNGGGEPRIRCDTIKSKLNPAKENDAFTKLMLEICNDTPASARTFIYSVLILKLLHHVFTDSGQFKKPKTAAIDYCNYLHFLSGLPVPDSNPKDAYASSNFDAMATDPSGKQRTYPLKKAWLDQYHKYKKHFVGTVAEGTMFAPLNTVSTVPLEKHLANSSAFTVALCILRCGSYGLGSTENVLRAILSAE